MVEESFHGTAVHQAIEHHLILIPQLVPKSSADRCVLRLVLNVCKLIDISVMCKNN